MCGGGGKTFLASIILLRSKKKSPARDAFVTTAGNLMTTHTHVTVIMSLSSVFREKSIPMGGKNLH